MSKTIEKTNAEAVDFDRLVRPETRGELRDRLKNGERCEVAFYVAESTVLMLHGWLEFHDFDIRLSPNQGWVIFEPNSQAHGLTQ